MYFQVRFFICELCLTLPKKYILYVIATHLDLKRNAISSYVALVADGMVLFISQAKWCCNCWFDSINLAICLFNFSAEKATQNISFETWAILFSLSVFVNIENSLLHNFDVHCKKFSTLFTNYMKLCSKIPKQFL